MTRFSEHLVPFWVTMQKAQKGKCICTEGIQYALGAADTVNWQPSTSRLCITMDGLRCTLCQMQLLHLPFDVEPLVDVILEGSQGTHKLHYMFWISDQLVPLCIHVKEKLFLNTDYQMDCMLSTNLLFLYAHHILCLHHICIHTWADVDKANRSGVSFRPFDFLNVYFVCEWFFYENMWYKRKQR